MSAVLAAGIGCSGAPDHDLRCWAVDSARRLRVIGDLRPEVRHGLSQPIPGAALPLVADPWRFIVLFNDCNAVCLDGLYGRVWRPLGGGTEMKQKDLVAAGALCAGGFWTMDRDRNIGTWSPTGRASIGAAPVPGDVPIVAVDPVNSTVLMADGGRYAWSAGGWRALPGLLDETAAGMVRVRCVSGVALGAGRGDLNEGDVVDMPESEARRLLADRRIEFVGIGDQ